MICSHLLNKPLKGKTFFVCALKEYGPENYRKFINFRCVVYIVPDGVIIIIIITIIIIIIIIIIRVLFNT